MTKTKALNLVYRNFIEPAAILDGLLYGKELDFAECEDIKEALTFLVVAYYRKDDVPKKLAYAITRASGYFVRLEKRYKQEECEKIYTAWEEIQEIAVELFKG